MKGNQRPSEGGRWQSKSNGRQRKGKRLAVFFDTKRKGKPLSTTKGKPLSITKGKPLSTTKGKPAPVSTDEHQSQYPRNPSSCLLSPPQSPGVCQKVSVHAPVHITQPQTVGKRMFGG